MEIDYVNAEIQARALRARELQRLSKAVWQYATEYPERRRLRALKRRDTIFELKHYFKILAGQLGAIHFAAVKQHHDDELYSDYALQPMDNGITRTSSLYYVITRDVNNGNYNIFWSRAQKYLATEVNENGIRQFVMPEGHEENQFRYHLPTLPPSASKKDIRDAIRKHHGEFRDFSWQRMRLHTADFTRLMGTIKKSEEQKDPETVHYEYREVLAFANLDFSLSVQEYPDGKWRLKMHAPIKKSSPDKSMVDSYSLHTGKNWLNEFFTNARTIMEFDTRAEALAYKHLMGNHRTQRTWRGQNPNPISEAAFAHGTTSLYNFTVQEINDRENIDESEFDTGITVVGALALGAKFLFSLSTPKLIIGAVISGFSMRKGVEIYKRVKAQLKWHKPGLRESIQSIKKLEMPKAKGIDNVDPDSGPYRVNTKDNNRRPLNSKPRPEVIPRLEVLDSNSKFPDGHGVDITHDDTPLVHHREKFWKERWIMAFDAKAFGGTTSGIDRQTSTDYSFNGLIRLSHRCPKTRKIITYARYVEALDVNDKISIPDEIKKLFEGDKIIRISQAENKKSFQSIEIDSSDILSEMCEGIEPADCQQIEKYGNDEIGPCLFIRNEILQDEDYEKAKGHISWLFNSCSEKRKQEATPDIAEKITQPAKPVQEGWAKEDLNAEKMKRFFGSDWEEMRPSDQKVQDLADFFEGAIYPSFTPYIEDTLNLRKKATNNNAIPKATAA